MSERKLLRQFSLGKTYLQQYDDGTKVKVKLIKLNADIDSEAINTICDELNQKKLMGTLTDKETVILNMLNKLKNK